MKNEEANIIKCNNEDQSLFHQANAQEAYCRLEIPNEFYKAGELVDELADDYGCDRLLVEEAIRYELPMPA